MMPSSVNRSRSQPSPASRRPSLEQFGTILENSICWNMHRSGIWATRLVAQIPERCMFQQMLFSKIVPNCSKLGLLDAGDGWLRDRFTELGIIGFAQADGPSSPERCYDRE